MANPAAQLVELFESWKPQNSNDSMATVRKLGSDARLERMRTAFRLIAALEDAVADLEKSGVNTSTYQETLNFCTRVTVGSPGAWANPPKSSQQFPSDNMATLESLGHVIDSRRGGFIRDVNRIGPLLD